MIYYVGHMVSSRTGDLLLHMGDATPALIREMNQHGPPPLVSETSPLSAAGNLLDLHGQLREIANRAGVQVEALGKGGQSPNPTPGFVTLDSLHGMAAMSGVPFALIVDGCLQDSAFTETMGALGFSYDEQDPAQFYYVGPSEVVTREAWDMATAMRNYGRQRPFLTDRNPVVLSAKPGTFAMARGNPFLIGGPAIGPLSERAHRLAQTTLLNREPWDLCTMVHHLAEFNGVGEINLEGSISWSDFEGWKLAKARSPEIPEDVPVAEPKSSPQVPAAVIERFAPEVGRIQDFALAEGTKDFILSDFDSNIWTWRTGQKAEQIATELPFSSIGATSSGLLVFHGGQTNELRATSPGHPLLAGELFLGLLAPGHQGSSLLIVEDDGMVDHPSRVQRLKDSKPLETVAEFETTGLRSAVEWQPGKILFTNDSSSIYCWEKDSILEFCRGLADPMWLACDNQYLYCLSGTGRTLHRISAAGKIEVANLESFGLSRGDSTRAFQSWGPGRILVGSDSEILAFETSKLNWQDF